MFTKDNKTSVEIVFDQCVAPSGIINYQNRIAVKTQLPSKLKFFASLLIFQRKASITRLTKKKEKYRSISIQFANHTRANYRIQGGRGWSESEFPAVQYQSPRYETPPWVRSERYDWPGSKNHADTRVVSNSRGRGGYRVPLARV